MKRIAAVVLVACLCTPSPSLAIDINCRRFSLRIALVAMAVFGVGGGLVGQRMLESRRAQATRELEGLAEAGDLGGVKTAVANGARLKETGRMALMKAAKNNHVDVMKYLVEEAKVAPEAFTLNEAMKASQFEAALYLMQQGVPLSRDAKESHGKYRAPDYVFDMAAAIDSPEMVQIVLDAGTFKTRENDSLLRYDQFTSKPRLVKQVLDSYPAAEENPIAEVILATVATNANARTAATLDLVLNYKLSEEAVGRALMHAYVYGSKDLDSPTDAFWPILERSNAPDYVLDSVALGILGSLNQEQLAAGALPMSNKQKKALKAVLEKGIGERGLDRAFENIYASSKKVDRLEMIAKHASDEQLQRWQQKAEHLVDSQQKAKFKTVLEAELSGRKK